MEGPSQGHRSRPELRLAAPARGRGKPHSQRTAACNVRSWRRRRGPRRPQRPACAARATGSIGGAGLRRAAASGGAGRVWRWHVGSAAGSGGAGPRRAAPVAHGVQRPQLAASAARGPGEPRQAAPTAARGTGEPRRAAP
jgi:hypothetical protein